MSAIERLDESVAARIAAGEVVERPVSVVKELLENSIDSGARDISLSLEQGGKASIVIEDDGCGIAFDELPLAVERYATSKIRTLADLEKVATLGYRGEALSSIAAVSKMEIRSRQKDDSDGGMIAIDGGVIKTHVRIGAQQGTRIKVDDLFYNLPARRKFLKTAQAELKRVIQAVNDAALSAPRTRFRVVSDGRRMLDVGGVESTDEVLVSLWGKENRSVSATVSNGSDMSARMWWNALPGSRRVSVTLFVNGRRVQDATVRSAMNSTGGALFGEWVIMISIPPEEVDVNIHPAKAEIRFRRTGPIFELIRKSTEQMLLKGGGFSEDDAVPIPTDTFSKKHHDATNISSFAPSQPPNYPRTETISDDEQRTKKLFAEEDVMPRRKYLGQAQGGYLVFDDPRGLCLLDPHAAHERILYEEIENDCSGRSIDMQKLMTPQEIPPALVPAALLHKETLRKMGFSVKSDPETSSSDAPRAMLVAVPVLRGLGRLSPIEMFRCAIRGIEEEDDPSKRDREVWWRWARTACRDAVKLGDHILPEEARALFDKLERCRHPYSCPHGRPTTIFLASDKLKSWFER